MRTRWFVVTGLIVAAGFIGPRPLTPTLEADGPVARLHAVGDLPGGGALTVIRDATKVGDTIYAVGVASTRCATCMDTSILWQSDGTTSTLQALPDLTTNTGGTALVGANAITPDATYIASQARAFATGEGRKAVRVTRSTLTNLNLNALFSPELNANASAVSISSAPGSIGTILAGTLLETVNSVNYVKGVRFDTVGGTSQIIPFLNPADIQNPPAAHGMSADGSVIVGRSGNPGPNRAYRYVQGLGVTAIPLLPGGTSNNAIAVSADGDLTLVSGNGTGVPGGAEPYLYRASTNTIERLGSPNTAWSPTSRPCFDAITLCNQGTFGGMTADGSVIAMSWRGNDGQYAYFHNARGWFHLASVLGAQGADLTGWDMLTMHIRGISPDGRLVYGSGSHNGLTEGFVAEFGADVLKDFNPQPAPPTSTALVGTWTFDDDLDDPSSVIIFAADGTYHHIEANSVTPNGGYEGGLYTFDGSETSFTTLLDTNGSTGLSDTNGFRFSVSGATSGDVLFDEVGNPVAHRLVGPAGSLLGGWMGVGEDGSRFMVASAATKYFSAGVSGTGIDAEVGTFTYDPVTHEFVAYPIGKDPDPGNFITVSPDERTLHVLDDEGDAYDLARVIDPATPQITSALTATATTGILFTYQITATNTPTAFNATSLPDGLSVDASGLISGTPQSAGVFDILLEASNTQSTVTGRNHLELTITPPRPNLQVVKLVVPKLVSLGSSFGVTDRVRNAGLAGAAPSTTRLWLSADGVLDEGDTPLGERLGVAIAAGRVDEGTTNVTLPASLPPGRYVILAKTDANDEVDESDETDNLAVASLTIGPDYTVSGVVLTPVAGTSSAPTTVSVTTSNRGGPGLQTSVTRLYRSADALIDEGDELLASFDVAPLAAQGTSVNAIALTLPVGKYRLIAVADATEALEELDETNNSRGRGVTLGADLTVASVTLDPLSPTSAAPTTITVTTTNVGVEPSASSVTRVYRSVDSVLDGADEIIGDMGAGPLAPGATATGGIQVTLSSGSYYLLVVADAPGEVDELRETNNVRRVRVRVP